MCTLLFDIGVHLTLFISTFHVLFVGKRTKQDYFFLAYISLLFVLGNIGNGTNIKFGELTFIDNRNYAGGPNAFFVEQSTNPVAVICNCVFIVNSWLQDALLLYRLWIVSQRTWYIMAVPSLMFLASVVFSLFLSIELSQPNITLWSKISVNLAIPYWSISFGLNALITLFIAGKLLTMRRRIRNALGGGANYVSITAMLIESAALYTVNGLIFLISYAMNSPIQNLALPALGQTQSIAPLLIILRVAQGRAWSKDTMSRLKTPMKFVYSTEPSDRFMGEDTLTMPRGTGSSTVFATIENKSISDSPSGKDINDDSF